MIDRPRIPPGRVRLASGGFLALALAGCVAGVRPTGQHVDDAAVYRAVLASVPPARLVQRSTQPPLNFTGEPAARIQALASQMHGLDAPTVRSFLARNRTAAPLPDLGDSTIAWIGAEEWKALANQRDGWDEILGRAPSSRAVVTMSRPGYSPDASKALLYLIVACPALCSEAQYVLLAREGGTWTIVARAQDWVS